MGQEPGLYQTTPSSIILQLILQCVLPVEGQELPPVLLPVLPADPGAGGSGECRHFNLETQQGLKVSYDYAIAGNAPQETAGASTTFGGPSSDARWHNRCWGKLRKYFQWRPRWGELGFHKLVGCTFIAVKCWALGAGRVHAAAAS